MTERNNRNNSKAGRRKQYSAPALSKGLDIVELLASESQPLTLKEIADQLERSKGEIFRMLVVLEERSYVATEPGTDRFNLTLKLFELAHRHPRIRRLTNAAAPFMAALAEATKQSCHLVIFNNGGGLVIAQQDSPSDRHFGVRLGAEVPLANTCSGHILLAFADSEQRSEMLGNLPTKQRRSLSNRVLEEITVHVKELGYESVDSKQVQGVRDVGFPIFDYSGKVVAALIIPFLAHLDDSHAVNFESATSHLSETAKAISNSLGFSETR